MLDFLKKKKLVSEEINKNCTCCSSEKLYCCYTLESQFLLNCQNCGLYFFADSPSDKDLSDYYKTIYSQIHQKQLHDLLKVNYDSGFFKTLLNNLKNYHGQITKENPKILDYGCGHGFFLKVAKENGFEAYGVEYDDEVAKFNENELKIKMLSNGELENTSDNTFDIIRMNHSLEHLPHPEIILEILHKKLKPNGIIVISSPNFSQKIVKSNTAKLYDLVFPEHLYYFTLQSIIKLLTRLEFSVETNITQFANIHQVLRILGINSGTEIDEKDEFYQVLKNILENEPFFAGANFFVTARKKTESKQRSEDNKTNPKFFITLLRKYLITGQDLSNVPFDNITSYEPKERGHHFNIKSNNLLWNILFPFQTNYENGKIYLSGTVSLLNSLNTSVSVMNSQMEPLEKKTKNLETNEIHNFLIENNFSNEEKNKPLFVSISGYGNAELFVSDLIVTEHKLN